MTPGKKHSIAAVFILKGWTEKTVLSANLAILLETTATPKKGRRITMRGRS